MRVWLTSRLCAYLNSLHSSPTSPDSPIAINPAVFQLSQPSFEASTSSSNTNMFTNYAAQTSSSENAAASDLIVRSTPPTTVPVVTKPVPPPPVQTRRFDAATQTRVVYPPKDSCYECVMTYSLILKAY